VAISPEGANLIGLIIYNQNILNIYIRAKFIFMSDSDSDITNYAHVWYGTEVFSGLIICGKQSNKRKLIA
jgi:hypothetical protein